MRTDSVGHCLVNTKLLPVSPKTPCKLSFGFYPLAAPACFFFFFFFLLQLLPLPKGAAAAAVFLQLVSAGQRRWGNPHRVFGQPQKFFSNFGDPGELREGLLGFTRSVPKLLDILCSKVHSQTHCRYATNFFLFLHVENSIT